MESMANPVIVGLAKQSFSEVIAVVTSLLAMAPLDPCEIRVKSKALFSSVYENPGECLSFQFIY